MIPGLSLNTGRDSEAPAAAPTASADPGFPFPWDPGNARQLLQWTIDARLDHLIAGFELGNEQNSRYTAEQMATNTAVLYPSFARPPCETSRRKSTRADSNSSYDIHPDASASASEKIFIARSRERFRFMKRLISTNSS